MVAFDHYNDITNLCAASVRPTGQRAADVRLFDFYLSHGLVRICPNLVCENITIHHVG